MPRSHIRRHLGRSSGSPATYLVRGKFLSFLKKDIKHVILYVYTIQMVFCKCISVII